jgi:hypothetical protein
LLCQIWSLFSHNESKKLIFKTGFSYSEEGAAAEEPEEGSAEEGDGEMTPRTLQKRVDALTESITF